jgi:CheY-like chemotaxis protein
MESTLLSPLPETGQKAGTPETPERELRRQMHVILGMAEALADTPLAPEQIGYLAQLREAAEQLLPAVRRAPRHAASASQPGAGWEDARALVVDACPTHLEISRNLLKACGFRVTEASSASAGLETLGHAASQNQPFHFALFDLDEAGADGLKQFAQGPWGAGTALAACGCEESPELPGELAEAGIVYLPKPFIKSDLQSVYQSLRRVPAPVPKPRPELNLLLLDETPGQLDAIRGFLSGVPHKLTPTSEPAEAAALFRTGTFDMALVTVGARSLDRMRCIGEMRAAESSLGGKRIPILAISTPALAGREGWRQELDCDAWLVKPIRKRELLDALRRFSNGVEGAALPEPSELSAAIRALAPRYLEMQRDNLAALGDPVKRMDSRAAMRFAQGLAGTAGELGFTHLASLGARLESASRQEAWPGIRRYLEAITKFLATAEATYPRCA